MEHARLHLTIKERMHPDGLSLYDSAAEALRAALAQPEPEAPRDEWRPASDPPDTPPHDYLLKKLAMVMPLFEEARDALTAISEQQRAVRCISPTLADRMDMAGTYSIDDWRDAQPPTEGE